MSVSSTALPRLGNTQPIPLGEIPIVDFDDFRDLLVGELSYGGRLSALFAKPDGSSDKLQMFAVVGQPQDGTITVFQTTVGDSYPSLTPLVPAAQGFEREMAEQWGVVPERHPWFRPLRYHRAYRAGRDAWNRPAEEATLPAVSNFFRIDGKEVHEVAVGPIHAGVIEPGHFRFSCYGEIVHHLEIALGYQHRGIERALRGGPNKRTIHYMETLSGDASIGHAIAYCQLLEALAGVEAPIQAQAVRGIAAELERLANHVGDLGALALDVAYLPTSSYCGRLRGDFLNASAAICGSRFGRGLVRPGGTAFDVDANLAGSLVERLTQPLLDTKSATDLMWSSTSTVARFEDCCPVKQEDALALGLVGMAARSCGIDVDVRRDFPTGIYRFAQVPVSTVKSGDVYARALL
ncbi:MAG TPA: NADH-quinone oxidoreductase subunit C, partial [Pirellulales bacterium]